MPFSIRPHSQLPTSHAYAWPRWLFWSVFPTLLAIDQLSKLWIERTFELGEKWPILPGFFNLTRVHNYGIAFGVLQGYGAWVAIVTFIAFICVILWIRPKIDWSYPSNNLITALILSGALGNWIDRARLGYVVDFADFYIDSHHWPVFNVADSCICISITWLAFKMLFAKGA